MSAAAVLNDVNWCALGLAVLNKKFTVERALDYMCGAALDSFHRKELTNADIEDMIKMRNQPKPVPYYEIGEIYGMNESAVWRRVKRYEGRKHGTHSVKG